MKKLNKISKKFVNVALCLFLAFCTLIIWPARAHAATKAKTYSWKTQINAEIGTNGAIRVNETKIIDITKFIEKAKSFVAGATYENKKSIKLDPLVWEYRSLPEESDITIGAAKIAILSNTDTVIGNWQELKYSVFLNKWKDNEPPDSTFVTYDEESKDIYLYTQLVNEQQFSPQQCAEILTSFTGTNDPNLWTTTKAVINMNYSIDRAAKIYKDVADFKWEYCSSSWFMDSYDVDLSVNIPVGSQSIASPLGKVTSLESNLESETERNIYAWGHGSSSGIVDLNPQGIIKINNKIVPGNSTAELRIVFPSAWLENLDTKSNISQQNQSMLTQILKEESVWKDYRTDAVNKMLLPIIFTAIYVSVLTLCLIFTIIFRRKFSEEVFSKNSYENMHPCLIEKLKHWNHEYAKDMIISIVSLINIGYITTVREPSGTYKLFLKNKELAINPYSDEHLNIIDKRTINFLFTTIACKKNILRLSDIENFANARPYNFMANYLSWQSLLTDEIEKIAKFKSKFDKARKILFGTGAMVMVTAIILSLYFNEYITLMSGIVSGIAILYLANSMRNKIIFIDEKNKKINPADIHYTFKNISDKDKDFIEKSKIVLKQSILNAQDLISKWNLENTGQTNL